MAAKHPAAQEAKRGKNKTTSREPVEWLGLTGFGVRRGYRGARNTNSISGIFDARDTGGGDGSYSIYIRRMGDVRRHDLRRPRRTARRAGAVLTTFFHAAQRCDVCSRSTTQLCRQLSSYRTCRMQTRPMTTSLITRTSASELHFRETLLHRGGCSLTQSQHSALLRGGRNPRSAIRRRLFGLHWQPVIVDAPCAFHRQPGVLLDAASQLESPAGG